MRALAAPLVPKPVKRLRQRLSDASFRRLTEGPTKSYVGEQGLTVRGGPFTGMEYLPGLELNSNDLVTKLLGCYEAELHPAVSTWIASRYPHIVDVGCAEGYYAVGLARALPASAIWAFDSDPTARERCRELAEINGVSDRVAVEPDCTHERLERLPDDGVALLVDCEGCEAALLDPVAAPNLAHWAIVVELHEFLIADVADRVRRRFSSSHTIELIDQQGRDGVAVSELSSVRPRARRALLSERRPAAMRWAVLTPRR